MSDALANVPRLLSKQVPAVSLQIVGGNVSKGTTDVNGWEQVRCNGYPAVGSVTAMAHFSYIDLAGYKQSDLTFIVNGINCESAAPPTYLGTGFVTIDLLTTQPYVTIRTGTEMTIEDNNQWYLGQSTPSPGMLDSILDMEQVLYCKKTTYYHDTTWSTSNLQQISAVNQYGQCAAIAGDRIYVTRLVFGPPGEDGTPLEIPSTVYNVTGVAVEEDDRAYIMRLRRDYELAKTVDA